MTTAAETGVFAHLVATKAQGPTADAVLLTFVNEATGEAQTRSYSQLYRNANAMAAYMTERGMKVGDRFGAMLQNHPEFVEAMIAASIAGTVIVPIDPRTKGDKLTFVLKDSDCRGILCADYNAVELAAVAANTGLQWSLMVAGEDAGIVGDGLPGLDMAHSVINQSHPLQPVCCTTALDPLQILYTSGTTGDPKGIVKRNADMMLGGLVGQLLGLGKDDVLYTGLSLTHGNAQGLTLAISLFTGIPSVYSQRFTKSKLWQTVRQYNCTVFNLLGGMTTAIYADPCKDDDADNPIRLVLSAGMPAAIWKDFESRFDLKLFEAYGAAEGGIFWNDGTGPVGAMGNIVTNPMFESRIVDEDDNDVAAGQTGELIWRNRDGRPVVVEYLNKEKASAEKTRDGWFRTGDIVHADQDGWLFFDYRAGGGIRRNGDFINPGFVEKVLGEIDSIDDVFVYGVPIKNGTPGEKDVVAALVINPSTSFDADQVFAVCRQKLESSFIPSFLQIVENIPKTASEKPQERFLLDMFSEDANGVHRR